MLFCVTGQKTGIKGTLPSTVSPTWVAPFWGSPLPLSSELRVLRMGARAWLVLTLRRLCPQLTVDDQ